MNWRVLLSTVGFLLAGAALGYAIIFLVVLLARFRSQPEQPGGYMLGAGLAGAGILFKVIAGCLPPSCHYDIITPIVGVVFIVVALVGAALLVRAVRQHRF